MYYGERDSGGVIFGHWTLAAPLRMAESIKKLVESGVWGEEAMGDIEEATHFPIDEWPENEMAPAIDSVLTDFDERLWVRDYRFPDHDSVTWRVWDIGRARPLFRARLYARDRLLDARGDFVLVRRLDEFDVPRAVVSQLRSVPIQH